jgi:hypothetical protein
MSEYENTNDDLDFTVEDLTEDLDTTKVEDLAEELGIEATISEAEEAKDDNVISSDLPDEKIKKVSAIGDVNGAIGSTTAQKKKTPKKSAKATAQESEEKIAVFSTKNVTWPEVGKVYRGYNIVSKEAAEKWATRSHIRIATPEEFAEEFGK